MPSRFRPSIRRKRLAGALVAVFGLGLAGCSYPDIAGFPSFYRPTGEGSGWSVGNISGQTAPFYNVLQTQIAEGLKYQNTPLDLYPSLSAAREDLGVPPALGRCYMSLSGVDIPPDCAPNPDTAGAPGIAVLGDSHAEMWSTPLEDLATAAGFNLLLMVKPACPPAMVTFWFTLVYGPYRSCDTWRGRAIAWINTFKPRIVIVAGDDEYPANASNQQMPQAVYGAGLLKTLKELEAPGRILIVIGDIAYPLQSGPECLAAHSADVQACTTPVDLAAPESHYQAVYDAAVAAHAVYINTVRWMCTSKSCPAIIDGIEVYQDAAHITNTYAEHLEPLLEAALSPWGYGL